MTCQRCKRLKDAFEKDYLLKGHECKPIANVTNEAERVWWIGRLTKPIPGHQQEAYCLHIHTPWKDVVFALDEDGGDAMLFATIARIVNGPGHEPVNEAHVMQRVAAAFRSAVEWAPDLSKRHAYCGEVVEKEVGGGRWRCPRHGLVTN